MVATGKSITLRDEAISMNDSHRLQRVRKNRGTPLLVIIALAKASAAAEGTDSSTQPPTLAPAAHVQFTDLKESSGIIASRKYPGVFWSHNDSGDSARLFAIHRDGSAVRPKGDGDGDYHGLGVADTNNRDWEDIATDDAGQLYVGDIGNNGNARRDLGIYVVPEPDPASATGAAAIRRITYSYPDQSEFPPPSGKRVYDAESLFWADGTLWILSKDYDDTHTRLYRFGALRGDALVPEKVGEFDAGGMVTGADASRDGRRLAMVGYRAGQIDGRRQVVGFVWVFERAANGNFFEGRRWHRRFLAGQVEAICWDGTDLLLTNEPGDIFVMPFASLEAQPAAQ
jgi:hypothetical protein